MIRGETADPQVELEIRGDQLTVSRSHLFFRQPFGRPQGCGGRLSSIRLVLRSATSGFYGSITESIREAEPAWLAGLTAALLMPLANHSLELLVHWLRGTPKLAHSIVASVCFTAVSTLFNLYVMRQGALIVGEKRQSFGQDMRSMPRLVVGFIVAGPLAIVRLLRRRGTQTMPLRPEPDWENEGGWRRAATGSGAA